MYQVEVEGNTFRSYNAAFRFYGISQGAFLNRKKSGMSDLEAFTRPVLVVDRRYWTTGELATLRKHATTLTAKEIGTILNRTKGAVHRQASKFGISLMKRKKR